MARDVRDVMRDYRFVLHKSWFSGVEHPVASGLVQEIDQSIENGQMDKAVSLMKAVDSLKAIPPEGLEVIDKDVSAEDEEQEIDKGRRAALDGEIRSMDVSGNETPEGQTRRLVRKVGDRWVEEPKPAPHANINPEDTFLGKKG